MDSLSSAPASEGPFWMNTERSTGTTLMAVEYDKGVIIGADGRTSSGVYVDSRESEKLTRLTDKIYCCRSGSAADTQAVANIVKTNINLHKYTMGEEEPTVKMVASMVRNICYEYRDQLTAGILIAGYDSKRGGQVYSVPLGGMCIRQPIAMGGSGSTYLYGMLDSNFKENMTREEAERFISRGVAMAIARDGSSGGPVKMAVITEGGVERVTLTGDNIPKLWEG